jgi:predicted nucleic acid-binding protein
MNILIDTTIWSKAYRRKKLGESDWRIVKELDDILDDYREVLVGPVRQEVLSGIADKNTFENLKIKLDGFNNYIAQVIDYDLAAEYFNVCQSHGIQGSQVDYLICAIANRNQWEIFTEDNDFLNYRKYVPIKLYEID